jgi:CxxC motif-containing protein
MRSITSTVKTVFNDFPRLPVKTDGEVPLKDIFLFMEEINSVVVEERMKPGDFVLKRMKNTGINLVATNEMSEIED